MKGAKSMEKFKSLVLEYDDNILDKYKCSKWLGKMDEGCHTDCPRCNLTGSSWREQVEEIPNHNPKDLAGGFLDLIQMMDCFMTEGNPSINCEMYRGRGGGASATTTTTTTSTKAKSAKKRTASKSTDAALDLLEQLLDDDFQKLNEMMDSEEMYPTERCKNMKKPQLSTAIAKMTEEAKKAKRVKSKFLSAFKVVQQHEKKIGNSLDNLREKKTPKKNASKKKAQVQIDDGLGSDSESDEDVGESRAAESGSSDDSSDDSSDNDSDDDKSNKEVSSRAKPAKKATILNDDSSSSSSSGRDEEKKEDGGGVVSRKGKGGGFSDSDSDSDSIPGAASNNKKEAAPGPTPTLNPMNLNFSPMEPEKK